MPIYQLEPEGLTLALVPEGMQALQPEDDPRAHLSALPDVAGFALTLPKYRDGRAFSQARVLRLLGFAGDILIEGAITGDQVLLALDCGASLIGLSEAEGEVALRALARRTALRGHGVGRPSPRSPA